MHLSRRTADTGPSGVALDHLVQLPIHPDPDQHGDEATRFDEPVAEMGHRRIGDLARRGAEHGCGRTDHGVSPPHRVYVFTHDALLEESVSQLGGALVDRYRARIARWARTYIDRGRVEDFF